MMPRALADVVRPAETIALAERHSLPKNSGKFGT